MVQQQRRRRDQRENLLYVREPLGPRQIASRLEHPEDQPERHVPQNVNAQRTNRDGGCRVGNTTQMQPRSEWQPESRDQERCRSHGGDSAVKCKCRMQHTAKSWHIAARVRGRHFVDRRLDKACFDCSQI